jgi:uncharacterized membrane protein YbhN (UPF0104 family)
MLAAALALLAFLCIQPLGALQWRMLLPAPRPPYGRLLQIFSLGSTANNGINSVVGHATATALVARESGVGAGPAVALLVLDQLVVALVKLLVFGLAVLTVAGASGSSLHVSAALPLVGASVGLLLLLVLSRRLPTLPAWIPARLRALLDPVHTALRAPDALRAVVHALPVGLLIRTFEALAVVAVHMALGLSVPVAQLPLFLAATAIATMMPIIPANLGTYEGALVAVYLYLGVPLDRALSAAALQHACQLAAAIAPGLLITAWSLPQWRRSRLCSRLRRS